MVNYLVPICLALFAWWSTTALVLFLNHLPRSSYRWSIMIATPLMLWALVGLRDVADDISVSGASLAFVEGLAVWAWLEMTYFMGWITGPSASACPCDARGFQRFRYGLATSLYHELSVIAAGVIILLLTWDQPNQFGTLTFVILWLMRWSAKLNLFLGVPNVNHEWFPPHLFYLTTYIKRQSVSPLFPVSVLLSAVIMSLFIYQAVTAASEFHQTGFTLISVLLGLALLEHAFMAFSMQDSALWDWAKRLADRQPRVK